MRRLAAAGLSLILTVPAGLGLASCDSAEQETNAAANQVELARYLPKDTQSLQTVDVVKAREELELPEDANALPMTKRVFPRPKSPEAQLFGITSNAYPAVADAFDSGPSARGASPLDGSLVRAAAGTGRLGIVSTAEPIEDIEGKLELAGYALEGKIYAAGRRTPSAASRYVADAGSGRIVYANDRDEAKEVLKRVLNDAEPGEAAEALEPASGSVRLAQTNEHKRSCVSAFAAAMEATGEGAALALIIAGDKPETDRFDPKALKGIAAGTPTVLVDALLVPIRVKKPLRDGLDAITQAASAPPFKSYDCP